MHSSKLPHSPCPIYHYLLNIYKTVYTFEYQNYQYKPTSYPSSSQPEKTLSLSTFCVHNYVPVFITPGLSDSCPRWNGQQGQNTIPKTRKEGIVHGIPDGSAFLLAILTSNRLVGGRDPSNHENKSKSNDKSIPYYNSFDISSFFLSPPLFSIGSLSVA